MIYFPDFNHINLSFSPGKNNKINIDLKILDIEIILVYNSNLKSIFHDHPLVKIYDPMAKNRVDILFKNFISKLLDIFWKKRKIKNR